MQEVIDFIASCGYDFKPTDLDGTFHQFTDSKNQKGWYVGATLSSGKVTFTFGDWRRPGEKFSYLTQASFTDKDNEELSAVTKKINKEKIKRQNKAAKMCQEIFERWQKEQDDDLKSKYLEAKKLPQDIPGTAKHSGPSGTELIIPMYEDSDKICNLQTIFDDGTKSYFNFAKTDGAYFRLEPDPGIKDTYVCEGFATGVALHLATGAEIIVAFSFSNLSKVLKKFPQAKLAADNDADTEAAMKDKGHPNPYNPGKSEAQKLSHTLNVKAFMPPGENSVDYSDLWISGGIDAVQNGLVELDVTDYKAAVKPSSRGATDYDKDGIYVGDIKSFDDGFHFVTESKNGNFTYHPDYEGLRTYFDRKFNYKILDESRICYVWNGTHYEKLGDVFIETFAQKNFYPKPKHKQIFEFVRLILRTNVERVSFFNVQRKINFKNGYLDLTENKFYAHSKDVGFRYCLPYHYDPEACAPAFENFLDRVTLGDSGLQQLLLEFMGYALSGDNCWAQKALALTGGGSNGKSTFLNIMRAVGGEDAHTPMTLSDLRNEYKLQMLDGKLFNMAEETPSKSLLDSSHFKNIVGGGTVIVRQIYKAPYQTQIKAKLIFACNELPTSSDTTHAFYRRFIIVPFRATFGPEKPGYDPFIEDKLKKELSGIFNMIHRAYNDLVARKSFKLNDIASDAIKDFQLDSDPIRSWVHEELKIHPLGNGHDLVWVSLKELYSEYKIYCDEAGIKAENKFVFGKRFSQMIDDYKNRVKFGGPKTDRQRGLIGVTKASGRPFKSNKLFTYGAPMGQGITAQMALNELSEHSGNEADGPSPELNY